MTCMLFLRISHSRQASLFIRKYITAAITPAAATPLNVNHSQERLGALSASSGKVIGSLSVERSTGGGVASGNTFGSANPDVGSKAIQPNPSKYTSTQE